MATTSPRRPTKKRPPAGSGQEPEAPAPRKQGRAPRAAAPRRSTAAQIAAAATNQLLELTGREAEGVTGLERTDDGWRVLVEVVEVRRIPETTDVLALYEMTMDSEGALEGYRRVRRYTRGVPGED